MVPERWQQSKDPLPVNKRKGVCREAGAGHKEESFTREQRMGFYSPDFHRNGARGVAWCCSALHSSGWVLGPDALGFPPGLQQNGLKLLQRGCDSLASFFAPTLGFFLILTL